MSYRARFPLFRRPPKKFVFSNIIVLTAFLFSVSLSAQNLTRGKNLFLKGEYEKAADALSGDRPSVESLVYLSLALEQQGKYKAAKEIVTQIRNWDGYLPLLNRIGELAYALSDYAEAREHFERALAKDSTYLEARLNLGEIEYAWGNREKGRELLQYFVELYRKTPYPDSRLSLTTARACIYLNRVEDANDLFNDASKQLKGDWRVFAYWGDLFLEKYSFSDAATTFNDALKLNPNAVGAKIGLARLGAQSPAQNINVPELVESLLKDYENRIDVLAFAANWYVETGDRAKSKELAEKTLKKAPKHLDAITTLAKIALLNKNNKKFAELEKEALAINPGYAKFYSDAGDLLSRRYLFEESLDLYNKALAIDPAHTGALAGIGTAYSRLARLDEAKNALEKAFELDPYNVWTGNLLSLFDGYKDYTTLKTDHFEIRLHKDDAPIVGPYALALAEQAYEDMVPRYKVQFEQPITIEIFPSHDDFAVRCFGLPGSEAFLGICFGPLITMNSPKARPLGSFNWQETLWHEFAHVVHLTLSKNRVPRWLAEGVAVYEATRANRAWDMNMQLPLLSALNDDGLIPLKELNSGFVGDARRVTFSYYQSSQMVGFIVEKYGFDKLLGLLEAFKNDKETPEALKSVLSIDEEAFDVEFEAFVRQKFERDEVDFTWEKEKLPADRDALVEKLKDMIIENPKSFFANLYYGNALLARGDFEGATIALEQAKSLFPDYVSENSPYTGLAEAYLALKDTTKAVENLELLLEKNGKAFRASQKLHELAISADFPEANLLALETAVQISPYNPRFHRKLGDIYLAEKNTAKAKIEFEVELALNTVDKAGAHCRLAEALLQNNEMFEAKKHALKALEIAPTYERAQKVLLQTVDVEKSN